MVIACTTPAPEYNLIWQILFRNVTSNKIDERSLKAR